MNREERAKVVEEAERHVGYRAQPNRRSAFQLPNYEGKPWNGTFVDRVLHDALGNFPEVRFLSTVTALGHFVNRNAVYRNPKVGDVVLFNFSADPQQPFEQPHVGIVTDVSQWKADHLIRTVEGETSPGVPQGSQLADGVFHRVRYGTDVIGFVRPTVRKFNTGEESTVKMRYFDSNGKTVARAVETVQRALNRVRPAWTFNRGKRDGVFKSAFGRYARETGAVENRGEITERVLHTLGDETGLTVEP